MPRFAGLLVFLALSPGCIIQREDLRGGDNDAFEADDARADVGRPDAFARDAPDAASDANIDAFSPLDAGFDAGLDAGFDTGSDMIDAGMDAFLSPDAGTDAFITPPDAGTDAFVAVPDAFVMPDAFVAMPDAFVLPDAFRAPDAFVPPDAPVDCVAEACDRVDNDCDGQVDEDGICSFGGGTDCVSHVLGDHVYQVCPRATNWTDAQTTCMRREYNLVHIDNAAENAALAAWVLPGDLRGWIGLNDTASEGNFVWVDDGAPIGFAQWGSGEPTSPMGTRDPQEDCVEFLPSSARWNDIDCNGGGVVIAFTCEAVIRPR